MMKYKTIVVESKPITEKGFLGSSIVEPEKIDKQAFANNIENACNALAEEGYQITSVMPILRGHKETSVEWHKLGDGTGGAGWGYGYNMTDGVIILASKG